MKSFNDYLESIGEIGFVEEVSPSLVHTSGLPGLKPSELVLFENGDSGQTMDISENLAEILVFSKKPPKVGSKVVRTNEPLKIPLTLELCGRTVDAFGQPIDEKNPFKNVEEYRPIEPPPPGLSTRRRVSASLTTGTIIVDMMTPLGMGQRELIIGDRKTGKTSFLRRTAMAQASEGIICIYALIGKKSSDIKELEEHFDNSPVRKNVIIVFSTSQEPASVINLTPYTAMTIAEFFRDKGKHVTVILDDLSTHAKFYRETSLLAKRFPGRDSYPGDIFYIHSRLVERAGNFFFEKSGESSITCLPVVETTEGDMTGFVPTNLMSMTDGHIYFDTNLFAKGRRPAINHFVSVTRVGRQTQTQLQKDINHELSSMLSLYDRSETLSHFGAGLSDSVKFALQSGERIIAFFDQPSESIVPQKNQLFSFALLWRGFWQNKKVTEMKTDLDNISELYKSDQNVTKYIDSAIDNAKSLNDLLSKIDSERNQIIQLLKLTL